MYKATNAQDRQVARWPGVAKITPTTGGAMAGKVLHAFQYTQTHLYYLTISLNLRSYRYRIRGYFGRHYKVQTT